MLLPKVALGEFLMLVLNEDDDRPVTDRPDARRERIKHLLIGSRRVVKATIAALHTKGYAEVREWSKPQSAGVLGEPGEVVSVLIRPIVDP
jgi:hypothetical protein